VDASVHVQLEYPTQPMLAGTMHDCKRPQLQRFQNRGPSCQSWAMTSVHLPLLPTSISCSHVNRPLASRFAVQLPSFGPLNDSISPAHPANPSVIAA
jgi:hypothetical protein